MKPTVLYIGHFDGAPGSTENSYAYAFEKLGWHVERIEQAEAKRWGPDLVLRAAEVALPSCCIYTRTHNYTALGPEWTDTWHALEQRGITTASVHLDVFWGIPEREQWIAHGDPLFTTGTVFTADGRYTSEKAFFEQGINHQWCPPAIDERNLLRPDFEFEPCAGLPQIVWVGTSVYHHEWPWRAELVRFLRREYGDRLVEFGYGSDAGPMRDNDVLTTLYSSDTLVVGDSMFSTCRSDQRYVSDRCFETTGRGALLLHPLVDPDVVSPLAYIPVDELSTSRFAEIIEDWSWATNAELRLHIKARAWTFARQNTYSHRAAAILEHLGLTEPADAA